MTDCNPKAPYTKTTKHVNLKPIEGSGILPQLQSHKLSDTQPYGTVLTGVMHNELDHIQMNVI